LRNRGVKTLSAGDNGHGMVMAGKAPAILIEPFFGSSRHDCDAANTDGMMSRLALSILRGALNAIDSMPRQDLKESRTIRNANDSQKAVIGGGALIGGAATINTATKVLQDAKAGVAGFGFDGQSLLIAVMALIVGGLVWKVWSDQSKIKKARHDDHVQGVR